MFTEKKFQDVALVTAAWLMKENEAMKKQLDHLSNYTRRENIHIIGLPESVEMLKPADFVCTYIFGPNASEMPVIIDRVHQTNTQKPPADTKPRPLLVCRHNYRVRELVLHLASRHEGPILYRGKQIHFFPRCRPGGSPAPLLVHRCETGMVFV